MSATFTEKIEKITSNNILQRLKELEGYCNRQFGECAILLHKPEHTWMVPTKAQHEADPLLNKRRENAVLGARKLWDFLVDIIEPSLLVALRNNDRVLSPLVEERIGLMLCFSMHYPCVLGLV